MSPNVTNKKLLHEICNAYMYMIFNKLYLNTRIIKNIYAI